LTAAEGTLDWVRDCDRRIATGKIVEMWLRPEIQAQEN